jgi:hypothetical protein
MKFHAFMLLNPKLQYRIQKSPSFLNQTNAVINISVKYYDTLPGNGSINTFQHATMGAVFPVDECYISLLGSSQRANDRLDGDHVVTPAEASRNNRGSCFLCVACAEGL